MHNLQQKAAHALKINGKITVTIYEQRDYNYPEHTSFDNLPDAIEFIGYNYQFSDTDIDVK